MNGHQLSDAFYGANIRDENFDSVDLNSLSLNRLWLDRCTFVGTDLRHATLDGCHFKLCDFRNANFRGASVRHATFSGCDLRDADLRDTDLTGASFGSVNTGTEAGRTNLTDACLDGATLRDAQFENVVGPHPLLGRRS